MIFILGVVNDDLDFEYDENVSLRRGCGTTLHDQFWYFGGYPNKQQVNKLL